jgi:serine/threonine protein kinase
MGSRIGERLGPYVTTAHLADGAMSSVYEAQHGQTRAPVAVKILRPEMACDPVALERFRREYETAMALKNEHIVEVIDFGQTSEGAPFIAMELLQGETLGEVIAREGALSPGRTVRVVCQLALALRCAHANGIVHRDLKPGNIFICATEAGEAVRVLDFGSVKLQVSMGPKLTALGTTVGSPCYMSPEQAMGRLDVDPRSDLFSLAALVYEMATGEVAFTANTVGEILAKIIDAEPPPVSAKNPDYPKRLDDVVRRGLSKAKSLRFSSAFEFAEAVLAAMGLSEEVKRWADATPHELEHTLLEPHFSLRRSAASPPGFRRVAADERGFGPKTTIPPK